MESCHLLLGRSWQFDRDAIHHGQSNSYSFKLKGRKMTLIPLPPNQTHKPKTVRDKQKESALLINGGRVKRVITKGKPVFAVLMLESSPKYEPATLLPSVQPLVKEFKDVFPQGLPPGLPRKRGIEHQIDLIPGAPLPNKPTYRCNPTKTKEL